MKIELNIILFIVDFEKKKREKQQYWKKQKASHPKTRFKEQLIVEVKKKIHQNGVSSSINRTTKQNKRCLFIRRSQWIHRDV